ncbi:macro domain-containing protein [Brevibacillus fortis]|uniref:Appr-1-p processing protein n=1 Tax=Brevibacillus fortis TaxID=2126352 RepID=A0A2P7V2K1_9BACL|nr:macro domain-containing protein [Brevibacillus fortis]PSJ93459.1 Appr-1-p processing protein [Brevibacillus fortis]
MHDWVQVIPGNILEAKENIIVQQVNCMGVMGAGLAKQIRAKYPSVYTEYKQLCEQYADAREDLLGQVLLCQVGEGKYMANLFAQLGYGKKGVYTKYDMLQKGLEEVLSLAKKENLTIAIPYGIGCGLAGGDWDVVSKQLNDIFVSFRVKVYKWEAA